MPDAIPGKLVAPEPVPPVRQYSFTDWQVNNPTAPPPGDRLDAEFDRCNNTQSQTLDWVETSLNTDGTLRTGIVGQNQLVPGLFDFIANDAVDQVQPLVVQAQNAAGQALNSATAAGSYSALAGGSATQAGNSATSAGSSATAASTYRDTALNYANGAAVSAQSATNSGNHAAGDAAKAQDWGQVSAEWAEHMPDTIPPNILAIMGVTGDHWSSRWWANRADQTVSNGLDALDDLGDSLIAQFQQFYLGAFPVPPTSDNQGHPLTVGALYYNTVLKAPFVWTGTAWAPFVTPTAALVTKYIYVAIAGQTVFTGADRNGHPLDYNPSAGQDVAVFRVGLLKTPTNDYSTALNRVTLTAGAAAGDIVQIWVQTVPVVSVVLRTQALDTSGWVFDGARTAFPLVDRTAAPVVPGAATDVWLSLDGVWQQALVDYTTTGSSLTFARAPPASALVFATAIVVTSTVAMAEGVELQAAGTGVSALDTSSWVFNGATATFNLTGAAGAVTPAAAENVMISLNGVWQAAYRDYTVAGSTITFIPAPKAGDIAFGVGGLP